jgi:hypothetical protein
VRVDREEVHRARQQFADAHAGELVGV